MSKYGYLEVFQSVPWNSRKRESTVEKNLVYQRKQQVLLFDKPGFSLEQKLFCSDKPGLSIDKPDFLCKT